MSVSKVKISGGWKLTGTGASEALNGGSGSDILIGNGGADTLSGGGGTDLAVFSGRLADYTWSGTAGNFTLHPLAGGGDDRLTSIEKLQFSDGTVTSSSLFTVKTVTGTGAGESLAGSNGNDLIIGNGGADTIDAAYGTDTAGMLLNKADYVWSGSADNLLLHPVAGGGDTILLNVESVKFKDVTVSATSLAANPSVIAAPAATDSSTTTPTTPTTSTTTPDSSTTTTAPIVTDTTATGTGSSSTTPATDTVAASTAGALHVGANQQYKTLASALSAAKDGDLIQIDAGTYNETATITKSVTIEGIGGMAHFQTSGDIANTKGIFIDQAASLTVRNLEFSGAQVAEGNGAGIRYEKGTLTMEHSFFHDNQNGIMGGTVAGGRIVIDGSEFLHNGTSDSQTHSAYVGSIASLTVTNSSFIDANGGIDLKTRAAANDIRGNSFIDSSAGTTTYEIDMPNGGDGTISGNVFAKSATPGNRATIHFGGELAGATGNLVVQNNSFWSDRDPTSGVLNQTQSTVTFSGNSLESTVSIPVDQGPGAVSGNLSLTGLSPVPLQLF